MTIGWPKLAEIPKAGGPKWPSAKTSFGAGFPVGTLANFSTSKTVPLAER